MKFTKTSPKDIDFVDVDGMRLGADWIKNSGACEWDCPQSECDTLADTCRSIADRVEAALRNNDTSLANHEAHQWPDEAGPWR